MRLLALCGFVFIGCSSSNVIKIDYQFVDNPIEQRVDVTFTNGFGRTICLSPNHWPNAAGKIDFASDSVLLVVDGHRFPVLDFNTGYCPGCSIQVAPGQRISAFVTYQDFELPTQLDDRPKILEFAPQGYFCQSTN